MNLFYSCVTSVGIVGAVWGLALMQPQQAIARAIDSEELIEQVEVVSHKATEALSSRQSVNKALDFVDVTIVGNTQSTRLTEVSGLISALNNNESVNAKLYQTPSKLYIFYRNFSANYDSATITVGYDKSELVGATSGVTLPEQHFENLLPKGHYSDSSAVKAWQDIDYGKKPQAVIEVHYLNNKGTPEQSEIFVSYEQGV